MVQRPDRRCPQLSRGLTIYTLIAFFGFATFVSCREGSNVNCAGVAYRLRKWRTRETAANWCPPPLAGTGTRLLFLPSNALRGERSRHPVIMCREFMHSG